MISTNLQNRFYTSLILISLFLLILNSNLFLIYSLIVCSVFAIIEFINLIKKIKIHFLIRYFVNTLFIIYIFIFCFYFFYF